MKKILFIIAVATLATSCNNDDKWDATGTFEATEVVVSAQGSGEIKSFNVEEGQQVEAGTQLGYLDMTQLELQKAQFDANQDNLNATKSQLDANKDHMNSSKLQIDALPQVMCLTWKSKWQVSSSKSLICKRKKPASAQCSRIMRHRKSK